MTICDLNMLFTYIWNIVPGSCHDIPVLTIAQESDPEFPLPLIENYYVVESGYPNMQEFLVPYTSSRNNVVIYHMSLFNYGHAPRNKEELLNRYHVSLRLIIKGSFGVWKKK